VALALAVRAERAGGLVAAEALVLVGAMGSAADAVFHSRSR
jgi:hypothetical protein